MNTTFIALFFMMFIMVAMRIAVRVLFTHEVSLPLIEKWARAHNLSYTAVLAIYDRGPFNASIPNRGQPVYRLEVTTGEESALVYIRVGHWLLGLLWPKVTVRWVELNRPPGFLFGFQHGWNSGD